MSATEVIAQIEKLPKEELQKVEAYLSDVRTRKVRSFFAWCDSLPCKVKMSEEEILALPRMILSDARPVR